SCLRLCLGPVEDRHSFPTRRSSDLMTRVLKTVDRLKCKDAWVCAGFIRNKVWDVLHDMKTSLNDIDVIYFDSDDISRKKEKELRSEEHTSELQSRFDLVCRLLLEKK